MRFWTRVTIATTAVGFAAVGAWCYFNEDRLARQWESYRIGTAATFEDARAEMARIEDGPNRDQHVRELVGKWGTGNQRFDLYLAWYVGQPSSSEFLRETFSLELAWREELLPRWAYYWSWRVQQPPDQEIASVLSYLEVLSAAGPKAIPWREVLNLQAVLALTGQPRLAKRLTPDNWLDRFQNWKKAREQGAVHVARPEAPFPDWRGPVPDRERAVGQ